MITDLFCYYFFINNRSLSTQVKEFVQLSNVYYAGSHGMDIMAPPRPVKTCDGKYPTVALDKKVHMIILFQIDFVFFITSEVKF